MTRRHRGPSERILIAGDLDDLPVIEHLIWHLSDDAYGQIFIEVLSGADVVPLDVPERVTVSWLTRCDRTSAVRPLLFAEHGEALAAAVRAWCAEWMPGEDDDAHALLWVGAHRSERVTEVYEQLQERVAAVTAHPGAAPLLDE